MRRKQSDWLNSYMAMVENTEPPRSYHLWTALSCISAALQRKCWVNWGGGITFYPNLYVVLVGPPGKTRKGTAMGVGKKFIRNIDIHVAAEATTREALIERLEEAQNSFNDEKTGAHMNHCSLTIISGELTVFLGHQNLTLMDNLTDWFDCDDQFTYQTKNKGTNVLNGVWVNLLGATTPSALRAALPMDMIGGGFASRVIFVYETQKYKVQPMPFYSKEEQQIFLDLQEDLGHIHTLQGQFTVTQQFLDRWCEWYVHQESNPPFSDPHFDGYLSRRQVHVMKLAMICSVAHSDKLIMTHEDLNRAIGYLEKAEERMTQVFTGIGQSPHAVVLSDVMSVLGERREMTFGQLLEMFVRDTDARTLESIIETLALSGFCKFKKRPTQMHASTITHIPPEKK